MAEKDAAFNIRNTGRVELSAMNGYGPGYDNTSRTGLFDIDADELVVLNGATGVRDSVTNYLRAGAAKSVLIDTVDYTFVDEVINPFRFDAFNDGDSYRLNKEVNPTLTVDQQNELLSLLSLEGPKQRYAHEAIPDPLGPNWKVGLADRPDSTNYIQSLVDKEGLAQLGEGVFYISSPIVLKKGQGILGSGMDKTVIVAKRPSVDIIVCLIR